MAFFQGVGQIIVAINKMDTVDWSNERYSLIVKKIGTFLAKMAGFKDKDVTFVPVSGLSGENLASPPTVASLTEWYTGGTLIQQIGGLGYSFLLYWLFCEIIKAHIF